MIRNILLPFMVLWSFCSSAEVVSIPLQYTGEPAHDLVDREGKLLSKIEVKKYFKKNGELDSLNPKQTDIWSNQLGVALTQDQDNLSLKKNELYAYMDKVVASIGSFRFVMRETDKDGKKRNFNVWLRKDSRSLLLRKNLLRKLGYTVPKLQHKQEIKVQFKGLISMNSFIDDIELGTFADANRWIVDKNEETYTLTLQDVLVFQTSTEIYDLSEGQIASDNILHRRSLNALSIPYALVDVRESVDGFDWSVGQVDNKVVLFDIISGDAFSTTFYDAKWMVRRLAKLTKDDLKEIVDGSFLPDSVRLLLVEKLASRRNSLVKIFFPKMNMLEVEEDVSDGLGELVNGRLTKDKWEGHAARYSFDDTESPLSKDEMVAYVKSKFYSAVIENLVNLVNSELLYSTDIQEKAIEHAVAAQEEQWQNFFKTGEFNEIPFSGFVVPTAKGNIAASRSIVTGNYLGTENRIQIADNLEFIGEVGAFIGTLGLNTNQVLYASGAARFSRSYSHIKSILSIKKALKEPFRNILVPYLRKKKAKNIVSMIDDLQSEEFNNASDEEKDTMVKDVFKELDNVMEVGDSLIVTNNLIFSGGLTGGYQIPYEQMNVNALLNINARKVNLWRLHITRSQDKTFQVYRSKASSLGYGAGLSADAYIPVMTLRIDKQSGAIKTEFHSVSFVDGEEVKEKIKKLTQLRQVIVSNSTELMTKAQAPFKVSHNFAESSRSAKILQEQSLNVHLVDEIKIKHPEGYEAKFFVRRKSSLSGQNYLQVGYDLLNGIISNASDSDVVDVSNTESGNPGDSFYGNSFSRVTSVELPLLDEGSEIPFENFAQVKSQWKGWIAGKQKINEIRKEIQNKYGQQIFNDELFFGTDEIELYSVDVTLSIYQYGLESLMKFDNRKFAKIIKDDLTLPWPKERSHFVYRGQRRFNKYRRDKSLVTQKVIYAQKQLSSDYENLLEPNLKSQYLTLVIDVIEKMLPFEQFKVLVGGDENFYLKGSINGFRGGIEDGEEAIISHSIGEYGSEFTNGIGDTLRSAINISGGELGAYWFLRRVQ